MKKPAPKNYWLVTGKVKTKEYGPKRYTKKPTAHQLRKFIHDETPEYCDIDGEGAFGSHVFLEVRKF